MRPNIIPADQYTDHLSSLKKSRKDFTIIKEGSVNQIRFNDKVYKFITKPDKEQRTNMEACKRVKLDIQSRMAYIEPFNFPGVIWQRLINIDNTELNNEYFWFDVERCYWQIAYNCKMITLDTFVMYYDNKEAGNMAIGALAKPTYIEEYRNGVMLNRTRIPNKLEEFNRIIRAKAYSLYLQISKVTDVVYYNIDEYVIQVDNKGIRNILKEHGLFMNASKVAYTQCVEKHSNKVLMKNIVQEDDLRWIANGK